MHVSPTLHTSCQQNSVSNQYPAVHSRVCAMVLVRGLLSLASLVSVTCWACEELLASLHCRSGCAQVCVCRRNHVEVCEQAMLGHLMVEWLGYSRKFGRCFAQTKGKVAGSAGGCGCSACLCCCRCRVECDTAGVTMQFKQPRVVWVVTNCTLVSATHRLWPQPQQHCHCTAWVRG